MIVFNALGNEMCGKILKAIPEQGTVYQYSNIGLKELGTFKSEDFLFQNKVLRGFNVSRYMEVISKSDIQRFKDIVAEDLSPGGNHYFAAIIQGEFPFEKYEVARTQYIKNMTKGKILLKS